MVTLSRFQLSRTALAETVVAMGRLYRRGSRAAYDVRFNDGRGKAIFGQNPNTGSFDGGWALLYGGSSGRTALEIVSCAADDAQQLETW